MSSIATSTKKSAEAYIATIALFSIFNLTKEDKTHLKLPPIWRDVWTELASARKEEIDAADRVAIKELRSHVRKRHDQEEEDGVILSGAFRGRVTNRNVADNGDEASHDRMNRPANNPAYYQKIWHEKSTTPKFQNMLVSSKNTSPDCFNH